MFRDFWPSHWPNARLLVLRSFNDGSMGIRSVTLAGFSAYADDWEVASQRWLGVCQKHDMAYLHMKDFSGLRGCFTGKNRGEAIAAIEDFVAVLTRLDPFQFTLTTCTVNLDDYRRAQQAAAWFAEGPSQKKAIDLCVDWCIGGLGDDLNISKEPPDGGQIAIFFDQNERFIHRVNRVWERRKKHAKHWPWVDQVVGFSELDSRQVPELQMADLPAWLCTRHYHESDYESWFYAVHKPWPRAHCLYDHDRLLKRAADKDPNVYSHLPLSSKKKRVI